MQDFEKVIALYNYTKELVSLKYKVISDIKKQLFFLLLNDIPQYKEFVSFSDRDYIETNDEDTEADAPPLLRVKKPDFQNCPRADDELLPWLVDGWDNYSISL